MNKKEKMLLCLIVMLVCAVLMVICGTCYQNKVTGERMEITGGVAALITGLGMFYHRWINQPNN